MGTLFSNHFRGSLSSCFTVFLTLRYESKLFIGLLIWLLAHCKRECIVIRNKHHCSWKLFQNKTDQTLATVKMGGSFLLFWRSELHSSTKPKFGLSPAVPSETSMWNHSTRILWVFIIHTSTQKSGRLWCLASDALFSPIIWYRWLETRRV